MTLKNVLKRAIPSLMLTGQIAAVACGIYGAKEIYESKKVETVDEVIKIQRKMVSLPRTSKEYLDLQIQENNMLRNQITSNAYQRRATGSNCMMCGGIWIAALGALNANRKLYK